MSEEIRKIIEYFKNDGWFTIFNAEEFNDEPYKLLNPIEVNQIIEYITKLQQEKQDLIKWLKSKNQFHYKNGKIEDNYILVSEVLNKVRGD